MSADDEHSSMEAIQHRQMLDAKESEEIERERVDRLLIQRGMEQAAAKKVADAIESQARIDSLAQEILKQRGINSAPSPGASAITNTIKTISISLALSEYEQTALEASTNISKSKRMAMSVLRQLVHAVGSDFNMFDINDDVVEDKWLNPRLKAVAASTAKRDLTFVRGFIDWAANRKRKYCPAKLSLSVAVTETTTRSTFTAKELAKIFQVLPDAATKAWHLWIPLIGLYTGARIGEIASLDVDHVYSKFDVDALHIPGTKTALSRRDIPIHPDLIEIGFLDYVKARKRAGRTRLFDIPASATNGAGAEPARWFGRYLDKLKISDDSKVFHSFRHTVIDHLRQAGAPIEFRCQYTGHNAGGGVHNKYGANAVGLPQLKAEVVERIDWQKYCGWSPDIEALKARAVEFLTTR